MSRNTMFDELCDKCGKSLFMIHPDDQFNCLCTEHTRTPVFIFQEDEEAEMSPTQLRDIEIGQAFIFQEKKYFKRSDIGGVVGIFNISDENGEPGHLHPTTRINLIH